jgi:hypothetical protein
MVSRVIDQVVNGLGENQQIVQNDNVAALDHVFKFAQFLNAQAQQFKINDGRRRWRMQIGCEVWLLLLLLLLPLLLLLLLFVLLLLRGVVVPGMNKANVSFVAVDVNDATNRGVVFNKGPGVEENFLQEMSLAGIASTGD